MLPLLVVRQNIAIQLNYQRRGAHANINLPESNLEKENYNKPNNTSKSSYNSKIMNNNDEIPSLRGWFLKEKRDTFKRRQTSIIPGTTSNRRWFTIERIANSNSAANRSSGTELALCYYKRSSENEQRCGWLFLNDVISLSQDIPSRWITIEHPTRYYNCNCVLFC